MSPERSGEVIGTGAIRCSIRVRVTRDTRPVLPGGLVMLQRFRFASLALLLLVASIGCSDLQQPLAPESDAIVAQAKRAVPAAFAAGELVTVTLPGSSLSFWPYTMVGVDIADVKDPLNLVLLGDADPRLLRARLMMLDGNRSDPPFSMPPVFPFNCVWQDAVGEAQMVYAEGHGWSGSAVQLECGDYEPIRFHVRFFPFGDWTLAGVHMDLAIPGTHQHEVISWQLARQVAMVDMLRLNATLLGPTPVITEEPWFKSIQPAVFGAVPVDLKGLLLATGSIDMEGRLLNDGKALIFQLPAAMLTKGPAEVVRRTIPIAFDQVIPRPFCTGDGQDYLYVTGLITINQQVVFTPSGNFMSHFQARGHLDVVQVNPMTGQPLSEPYRAHVVQNQHNVLTHAGSMMSDLLIQTEIRPGGGEKGQLKSVLRVGPTGVASTSLEVSCRP
jgi:hypothetical protein